MALDNGAARAQVDRILRSDGFRNSENLRRLLSYLAEKSLSGEADALKEYTVGVEAFGKLPDYDPQQDSSVRIYAGKLRQRLEEYYRTEGAVDPVTVAFPKGRFKLGFDTREPAAGPVPPPPRRNPWKMAALILAAALVVSLAAAARFAARPAPTASSAWNPALEELWKPFLESPRPLLISLGTPLFIRAGDAFFRDPGLDDWQAVARWPSLAMLERAAGGASHPVHIYTGTGEASAAFELARLLGPRRPNLSVKRAAVVTWDDIVTHDVIFLGSPKYNTQLKELPVPQDFVLEPGELRNLAPRPGEPAVLRGSWPPGSPYRVEDYALVTRIPGLNRRGEILILAANATEGTLAAAQFLTQPGYASHLAGRLRLPSGELPQHYQAVIRAKFKEMVPVQVDYQFHHVLDEGSDRAAQDPGFRNTRP